MTHTWTVLTSARCSGSTQSRIRCTRPVSPLLMTLCLERLLSSMAWRFRLLLAHEKKHDRSQRGKSGNSLLKHAEIRSRRKQTLPTGKMILFISSTVRPTVKWTSSLVINGMCTRCDTETQCPVSWCGGISTPGKFFSWQKKHLNFNGKKKRRDSYFDM